MEDNTDIALREYLQIQINDFKDWVKSIFEERDKKYDQRFRGIEEATQKKAESLEKRFEGVNEFRGAMNDAASKYITRSEAMAMIVAISTVIAAIVGIAEFFLNLYFHK